MLVSLTGLVPLALAFPQGEYGTVPAPAGGDIHSVYSVHGPPPQSLWMNARISSRGDSLQSFRSMNFTLLYGLHPRASFGVTVTHLSQDLGIDAEGLPVNKQGPGDTRFFLKWAVEKKSESPLMIGLCPSIRIPTGYDLEGTGLTPFTTRTIDCEFIGLIAFETPNVGVYLNPGISLPGGKWHNELLGGFGFDLRRGLPLGLSAKAEYVTRYDIVEDRYRHAIFASARRSLLMGLNVEFGIRRRLLKGTEPSTEMCINLFTGKNRNEMPSLQLPPHESFVDVLIPAVSSYRADPNGSGQALQEAIIGELARMRGISPRISGRGDYVAKVEILNIREGNGRGISIPKIIATPKATLEIDANINILDSNGNAILSRLPLRVAVKRGTGVQLLPSKGDEDTWLMSSQARTALLSKGIEKMAVKIAEEVARVTEGHESVQIITPDGGQ